MHKQLRRLVVLLAAMPLASFAAVPKTAPEAALDVVATPDAVGWGHSGALLASVALPGDQLDLHLPWCEDASEEREVSWLPHGAESDAASLVRHAAAGALLPPEDPGIWRMRLLGGEGHRHDVEHLSVITAVPFDRKKRGYLNGYHIGRYPTEGRKKRKGIYAPPRGFIEVTLENRDHHVSRNFRLRDFLTKDQKDVWPKYLVLDLKLVDKLELVLQELREMGYPATRMHVMSGYRTPQYNGPGGKGRSGFSRHMWGDAADVWIDDEGNGRMDDLNGDGRSDIKDARVVLKAVERVERKYPELVGGAGVYQAKRTRGPFIHIDTRGHRARWSFPKQKRRTAAK